MALSTFLTAQTDQPPLICSWPRPFPSCPWCSCSCSSSAGWSRVWRRPASRADALSRLENDVFPHHRASATSRTSPPAAGPSRPAPGTPPPTPPRLSLNGIWRFRLSPTATPRTTRSPGAGYDASGWDEVTVPGHWVLQGDGPRRARLHQRPSIPSRSTRRACPPRTRPVTTGASSTCRTTGPRRRRRVLRFEGVESCARVWLNGAELGDFKGSRLPHEFAVGAPAAPSGQRAGRAGAPVVLRALSGGPGPVVAARHLPRRDAAAPPGGRVRDFFVHAGYDHTTGDGHAARRLRRRRPGHSSPSWGSTSRPVRRRPCRSSRGARRRRGCTTASWPPPASGSRCASASARSSSRTGCSRSTAGGSCSGASTGTSSTPRRAARSTRRPCAATCC